MNSKELNELNVYLVIQVVASVYGISPLYNLHMAPRVSLHYMHANVKLHLFRTRWVLHSTHPQCL